MQGVCNGEETGRESPLFIYHSKRKPIMCEIMKIIPAVPLRNMVILPGMIIHFDINRPQAIRAVEEAMVAEEKVFLITVQNTDAETLQKEDFYTVGVIAQVKQLIKMPNNIMRVLVEGTERAELQEIVDSEEYYKMQVLRFEEEMSGEVLPQVEEAMLMNLRETLRKYYQAGQHTGREILRKIQEMNQVDTLIDMAANSIPLY